MARVVGSWFRDTYFIIPQHDDEATKNIYEDYENIDQKNIYPQGSLTFGNVDMIQNDEAFLEGTGELWTSYIMDPKGDYATFVINSDGSYLTSDNLSDWKNKIITVNQIDKDVMDEICSYIKTYTKDGNKYYGYIDLYKTDGKLKTPEEIKDLFDRYGISYIKRAVSNEVKKTEGWLDGGWSAYNYNHESNDDLVELDVGEFSPNKIKVVQENYNKAVHPDEEGENVFRYKLDAERVVSQKQDAQRGMTNIKIKYLFKNKKYYKYDGTQPTAYSISRDWDDILDIFAENDLVKKSNREKELDEDVKFLGRVALRTVLFGFPTEAPLKDNYDEYEFTETLLDGYIDNIYYQNLHELDKINFKFARDFDTDPKDPGYGIADIASTNFKIGDTYNGLKIDETTKFTYDPRNPNLISKVDINADSLSAFSMLENTHTASADYAYRDFKELIVELDYFDKEDLVEPQKDILEWILPETGSAGWPVGKYDKYNDFGKLIHSKEMYDNFDLLLETAQVESVGNDSLFEGFQKGQAIVSPATAKIIEMGTTTISNETSEQLFETMYEVRDEYDEQNESNTQNNSSDSEENSATKVFITESQKEIINNKSEELKLDQNNTFGKTYTTGYIKLEVIGKESVDKILSVISDKQTQDGITAFYEEYRNGKYDPSGENTSVNPICDSYTIYIEGIDFRLDQSEGASWAFENTIINQIIKEQENQKNNTSKTNNKKDEDKEQPKLTWTPKTETGEITKIIDNYTEKEVPKYYPKAKRKEMKEDEEKKKDMPFVINFDYKNKQDIEEKQIYVKAGTLLGLCTDANIKIMMKDTDYAVVENVEDYLEIDEIESNNVGGGLQQFESYSVVGTVLSESEWVSCALAYASNNPGDGVFNNESNLKEFYKICVERGINPEIAFVTAAKEQSLDSYGTNNYWGCDTPNGQFPKPFSTWQDGLIRFCEIYADYQDPANGNYNTIMERYNDRSTCTDFGGCDPNGYGKPNSLQGIQSVYSWLSDDHSANDSGAGGMYYLYPWGWGGTSYVGENKIIFEDEAEFEEKCGKIHNTSGGKTSNVATSVWEQAAYTAWQVKGKLKLGKEIFGEKAGTYAGPSN